MTSQINEEIEKIRKGYEQGSRIDVTQFGRSTQWRRDLERLATMEVVDGNQTLAVLLNPESFKALMTYLDKVDQELEQAQVDALFANRKHLHDWTSGEDLAAKAKTSLQKRQEYIRGILDGEQ